MEPAPDPMTGRLRRVVEAYFPETADCMDPMM
jgi:hypothetical protein